MTVDHVFPEDSGTGAPQGDYDDAANFGALAHHDNTTDYVEAGLSVTPTYSTPDFDLSAGKCFIKASSATAGQASESRDQGVTYEVEVASRTGIALTNNATNEIFVDLDLSSDDGVSITVTSDGSTPSAPYLKISEVDTSGNTETPYNRAPAGSFQSAFSVESQTGTSLLSITGSGPVEVQNTDLRLDEGQSIEDGGGVERLTFSANDTALKNQNSGRDLILAEGSFNTIAARSNTPLRVFDREGGFDAVTYTTSASAPGTFEFTNSIPTRSGDPAGETHRLFKVSGFNGAIGFGTTEEFQKTNAAASTATEIINTSAEGLVVIVGQAPDGDKFVDLLLVTQVNFSTVHSLTKGSDPPSRSYSNPFDGPLELTAGEEVNVLARYIKLNPSAP